MYNDHKVNKTYRCEDLKVSLDISWDMDSSKYWWKIRFDNEEENRKWIYFTFESCAARGVLFVVRPKEERRTLFVAIAEQKSLTVLKVSKPKPVVE